MSVVTRFAPSPTGFLHIGGARTALFCYLFAKRHGGEYLLRIEDTDRERSTEEAVEAIFAGLEWLGLPPDRTPVFQTQRFARYAEVMQQLLSSGDAYHCYCSKEELDQRRAAQMAAGEKPRYDGRCRNRTEPRPGVEPVVRFRNPDEGSVLVDDLIKGPIEFQNRELDDLIIARSDGTPTYNFCVVVDDHDMHVTHVIRGDDHVNNTPRQINILHAIGAAPPAYAHLPMILGSDGVKLSKRHGAVSVTEYRVLGFMPEALRNYLVRLGWSHGDQELFTADEMIALFDISRVQKAAARFDMEKAIWVNHQYLKVAPPETVAAELAWHLARLGVSTSEGPTLVAVVLAQRERCKTLVEMAEKSRFFFEEIAEYNAKDAARHLDASGVEILQALAPQLQALESWERGPLHAVVHAFADARGLALGKVAQPMRVALAGAAVSPPIDETLELLGRQQTLQRLARAAAWKSPAAVPGAAS